jgi:hypothetical protein
MKLVELYSALAAMTNGVLIGYLVLDDTEREVGPQEKRAEEIGQSD